MAVQIAKYLGAKEVIAIGRIEAFSTLLSVGADAVIERNRDGKASDEQSDTDGNATTRLFRHSDIARCSAT